MKSAAHAFKQRAYVALDNPDLRRAMSVAKEGFIENRRLAVEASLLGPAGNSHPALRSGRFVRHGLGRSPPIGRPIIPGVTD